MARRAPWARPDSSPRGATAARRKALVVLAATSVVASTGLAAGGTAGALLGAQLSGTDALAGLPLGLLVLGSAASSLWISRQTGRSGRGSSLAAGYGVGAIGAVVVVAAASAGSLAALLVGSVLLGAANASIFFTRYAAAEVGGEEARGRALGLVLFATAIGAVASPLLLGPSGDLAEAAGLPRLSGLFAIAAFAFAVSALTLGAASYETGRRDGVAAVLRADATAAAPTRHQLLDGVRAAPASLGLFVLATANFVMVAVMAVAPVELMGHGHDLETIGTAISFHVAGMFAPSPLSGWLADRVVPVAVAGIGCLLVLVAGLGGALVDQESARSLMVVLVILGVGWNFAVVGGSTLIARSVPRALRAHVEGIGEVAMGVAAAAAAPAAGVIIAVGGFTSLSLLGAAIAACALAAGGRRASSIGARR